MLMPSTPPTGRFGTSRAKAPRYCMLDPATDFAAVVAMLGLPLIVKPAHEGSSIGITKVHAAGELRAAFDLACKLDPLVIAEEFVAGQELTAAIVGGEALPLFEVLGCRGWGRADAILAPDGRFTLLEMNTAPGMTGHSLVPMAAKAAGLDFPDLVLKVLSGATLG